MSDTQNASGTPLVHNQHQLPSHSQPHPSRRTVTPPRITRSTPPPPKLNLQDCKPIIPTTTTNTSSNAARSPSSAFVFTSSRTLRTLHNLPVAFDELVSADVTPPSPSSPSTRSSLSTATATRKPRVKPVLSSAQLVRHSQGALDARCIVSANMRAAGFVPLTHSPPDPSRTSTYPITSVPTPKDPPHFPPVVFVNPTHLTTAPMWDYQRTLQYGLGAGPALDLGLEPQDTVYGLPEATVVQTTNSSGVHPIRPTTTLLHSGSDTSISSSATSISSSVSTSSSGLTSVHSTTSMGEPLCTQSSRGLLFGEFAALDGYPFPPAPGPLSSEHPPVYDIRESSRATVPPSPSVSSSAASTAEGSFTPLAFRSLPTPPSSQYTRPWSASPQSSTSTGRTSHWQSAASSQSDASSSQPRAQSSQCAQLSLTELCSASSYTWLAGPIHLPPASSLSSGRGSPSTATRSTRSSGGLSLEEMTTRSLPSRGTPTMKVATARSVVSEGQPLVRKEVVDGAHRQEEVSHKIRTHKPYNAKEGGYVAAKVVGHDSVSEKSGHRGRERDRSRDREKELEKKQERRRLHGKMRAIEHEDVDKDLSSSPTPSPGSKRSGTKRSSPRSSHKKDAKQRDRMQFTTQQFVHTQSYSSFTFPPPDHRKPAHVLGERDVALEREREREAGEFAKDQVLAHRERDRRHARRTEQRAILGGELIEPFKKHAGMPVQPLAIAAYDAGSARGRGRGRGRGEHPSGRGRSVSTASLSTVPSESETVVEDVDQVRFESIVET